MFSMEDKKSIVDDVFGKFHEKFGSAGLWTGEGLLLHRCPQLRWLQVHGYSAWKGSKVPRGRHP